MAFQSIHPDISKDVIAGISVFLHNHIKYYEAYF